MEKQFPVVYNPAQWDPRGWAGHTHLLSYRVVVVSTSEASVPVGVMGVAPTLQRRFPMVNHVFIKRKINNVTVMLCPYVNAIQVRQAW